MAAYGAKFELTPKEKGIKGSIEKAHEMHKADPNSWMPLQFDNKDNLKAHVETTAQEILKDFPDGLDYIVSGVGTGGHLTAVAKVLKEKFPHLKVIAVEPSDSPVLSGGAPGPHAIQGLGTGFIPSITDTKLFDEIIPISKDEAFSMAREMAKKEGILVGISSGAALAAVEKVLKKKPGKVLTFAYDSGERYLSVPDLL